MSEDLCQKARSISVLVNEMMKNKAMRNILLFGLFFVLSLKAVFGESDNEIKRGSYMFMAVVYYPDGSVVGPGGTQFSRSAVLIRPDWLVSSSLENNDTQLAFPNKTLMAKVGAITIDSNFTLNEDEGEQEREIIQIVRPSNFNVSQWWDNDITLLKTLLPFVMTSTVASTTLAVKRDYMDKTCYVLVFSKKYQNSTEDKMLMQLAVELLPSSNDNCGVHFRKETMICANYSDENKNIVYDPDFCYNSGGGPLMCEGDVIGLQMYIGNNCKQPYLYQLLSSWDDFISCGVDEKCRTPECSNICMTIDKDAEVVTFETNEIRTMPTSQTAKDFLLDQSPEESNDEEHIILHETTISKIKLVNENETPIPTLLSTEITTTKETNSTTTTQEVETTTRTAEALATSWPKEQMFGHRKKLNEAETSGNAERTTNVEAQRHGTKKKGRNTAESYINGKIGGIHNLSLLFLYFICNV